MMIHIRDIEMYVMDYLSIIIKTLNPNTIIRVK